MSKTKRPAPLPAFKTSRRALIGCGGAIAVLALSGCSGGRKELEGSLSADGLADCRDDYEAFLNENEFQTLQALVNRLIPGPPEDDAPGALENGCAEAIDALLGAFSACTPRIWAGAPFSDRGGHGSNEFENFLTLDPFEELAWRMRIEGSQGIAQREFNGPVRGYQQIYQEGLAALNEKAGGDFSLLPSPTQDLILQDHTDADQQAFLSLAFGHCVDVMYGPPEYGGNTNLDAWKMTKWDGDTQPRGFTDDEVTQRGPSGPAGSRTSVEPLTPEALAAFHAGLAGLSTDTLINRPIPITLHMPQLKAKGIL